MDSAARFVAQFFPIFLLGALFGKLMEDSGSVAAIARFMSARLGPSRAVLTVVLAGAFVTYGGVSLFVAFFVLVPMAQAVFRTAGIPNRLVPAAIALGTSTFTMSALPGTPAIQNAIPIPFFGTTPLAAPDLGIIAAAIMLAFGLWWLGAPRRPRAAKAKVGLPRSPLRSRGRPRTPRCGSAPPPPASSTPPKPLTAVQAANPRRSRWRRCRSLWSSASMSRCRSPSCRALTSRSSPKNGSARRRFPPSAASGRW
jgi:hypothetical protein